MAGTVGPTSPGSDPSWPKTVGYTPSVVVPCQNVAVGADDSSSEVTQISLFTFSQPRNSQASQKALQLKDKVLLNKGLLIYPAHISYYFKVKSKLN